MRKCNLLVNDSRDLCGFGEIEILLTPDYVLYRAGSCDEKVYKAAEIMVYKITTSSALPLPLSVKDTIAQMEIATSLILRQTEDIGKNILTASSNTHRVEKDLLVELLWMEHLSIPIKDRTLASGLLADWNATYASAQLPSFSGDSGALRKVEEVMERLQISILTERKVCDKRQGGEGSGKSDRDIKLTEDKVISFNVGGTVIAVLLSTLLRQAPKSTFAASYSGRWLPKVDEDGNILLVRRIQIIAICHPLHAHTIFSLILSNLLRLPRWTRTLLAFVALYLICSSKHYWEHQRQTM
jgi:hypothetical protein